MTSLTLDTLPATQTTTLPLTAEPPLNTLSVSELAERCMKEINRYYRGETCNDRYSVELLRRAMVQGDPYAWEVLQQCLSVIVRGWMRRHPGRTAACRLESEENYIALTFARFWQATVHHQQVEFSTLAAALRYLRLCLNAVILDMLRTYARSKEVPLPEPGFAEEPYMEGDDDEESTELWRVIRQMLPTQREQRVAYLLYHCGLKPREIVRLCPQEFSEVREIYWLRRNIADRLVRHADSIRWQLGTSEARA